MEVGQVKSVNHLLLEPDEDPRGGSKPSNKLMDSNSRTLITAVIST